LKAVKGISDIINFPGYQNVDFADVKATMLEKGMTLMGTGEAKGENRAEEATRKALTSPLLDDFSINGATGVLYNITAASNLTLKEIGVIAEIIKTNVAPGAKIKFGVVDDDAMGDILRVTVIATGFQQNNKGLGTRQKIGPDLKNLQVSNDREMKRGYLLNTPTPAPSPASESRNNLPNESGFLFKRKTTPANLVDMERDYLNEARVPSMLKDPESVDDILDVPSFQRPKLTEKK
jgi:cell division protein FtsZ